MYTGDIKQIHYFEWTEDGGTVRFGFHGTLLEWGLKVQTANQQGKMRKFTLHNVDPVEAWRCECGGIIANKICNACGPVVDKPT